MNLTQTLADVNGLKTPEEKITALTTALTNANDEIDAANAQITELQAKHDALDASSKEVISNLSQQLDATEQIANEVALTVIVDGKTYSTHAGRKLQITKNGVPVEITSEDLVKDVDACRDLIAIGSESFTLMSK